MRPEWLRHGSMDSPLSAHARELPIRALLPLGIAIFALFGLIGPVVDIMSVGSESSATVFINSALSGIVALGFAFGLMRRQWPVFAAAVVLQIIWFAVLIRYNAGGPKPVANAAHLTRDAAMVLVFMTLSYSAFLAFINGTASRYLTVRAEIAMAHQIHQVLVPTVETRIAAFEFFGFSHASGEVGGDLVDVVESSASDDASAGWFGYVADVSGHGVSSGLVMGMFKSALRMRLRQPGALADLLKDLNSVLLPLKSGSMFVTMSCLRYAPDAALEYAVAGHLPILRVRGGVVDEITTAQIPIAMFEAHPFTSATLDVRAGDLLALITDGVIEVFDAKDQEFGLERVKALLVETASRPLHEIADRLLSEARAHGKQLDDQTLLLIRRSESGRPEVGGR